MSSKSRKQSSKPSHRPKDPADGAHQGGAKSVGGEVEYAEPSERDFLEDDLKTPKGKNPITYAFMVLLLVFLTVIFILPPTAGQGGGTGADEVAVRWDDPQQGPRVLTVQDLYDLRNRFETTIDFGGSLALMPLIAAGFLAEPDRLTEADIVRLVMADQQAEAANVHVGDTELVQMIGLIVDRAFDGDARRYEEMLRMRTRMGGVAGFEETVRRFMRIQRYVELCAMAATVPERSAMEQAWHDRHQEYRFQWAAADVADFQDAARAEGPTDAELQTYLESLSQFEKAQYRTPATFAAELVGLPKANENERDLATLEARYPRPDDWDDEAEADRFYRNYFSTIYRRPPSEVEPDEEAADDAATSDGAEDEGAAQDGATEDGVDDDAAGDDTAEEETPLYWTFDEVRERAIRDARVAAALEDWRTELEARLEAGDDIDLAQEAETLGLDYLAVEEPLDTEGWRELGGLSNEYVASRVRSMVEPGQLSSLAVVGPTGITVVRLTERIDPFLPPASELRDELLEPYYEERALELAEQALEDLRDGLLVDAAPSPDDGDAAEEDDGSEAGEETSEGEESSDVATVDAEEFRRAAEDAGLRVGVRDWLDRRATEHDDENWDAPAHALVRSNPQLYSLEEGALSDVLRPVGAVESMYLVRMDGQRPMEFSRISAKELGQVRAAAQQQALRTFYDEGPFSEVAMEERYGLKLPIQERREQEQQ